MHLTLSLKVHSHESPQDPFSGLFENKTPMLINKIIISINMIVKTIVIIL